MKTISLTQNFLVLLSGLAAVTLLSQVVPLRLVIQLYLLLVIYLLFRNSAPFTRFLHEMPSPHALVFGLLLGAVVGGHFTLSTTKTFPLMSWAIFPQVDERDAVVCRQLIGTTESGKKVRLLIEQLFPSIIQYNLPPPPSETQDFLTPTVVSVARVYNQLHPTDHVVSIDHIKVSVPLHPQTNQPFPACETLQTYSFAPFPSN